MVKIKYNSGAFYDLRRAPGVVADLESRAKRVQSAAGEMYEFGSQQGARKPQGRWRTSVAAVRYKARYDNAKNHTLERSLDAGR